MLVPSQRVLRGIEEIEVSKKVSIILSFYNAEATLKYAIEAVLAQTYDNIEFILIDDGSKDDSAAIAEEFAAEDPRMHLIIKRNTGVSDSRNLGLDVATGEWVYFVDADDWLVPNAVETFMSAANDPDCDLVVCDFYRVQGDVMHYKRGPATGLVSRGKYATFMARRPSNFYYTSLWNKVFKRSIIEEHCMRFDTSMYFGEDHVFILDYVRLANKVALIDEALYYYVDTAGSLVHQGMNPFGVARMKINTYLPYLRLYKDLGIFDKPYQKPTLYKFLIMPATDAFAHRNTEPAHEAVLRGRKKNA